MPDYGHELEFGTFLTPQNQRPRDVVALAQLTERVGLDLATFQDHPYQPGFLDTWTLLSWVAAQTETLRVSGNVLNLPLRQPAVLARAAASLDLLSGGRLELALGAGAFWDAIEAMGVRRLSAGQSVDALGEAIDVIRAIWSTSEPGGVRFDGNHYRVWGAKRGPRSCAPHFDLGWRPKASHVAPHRDESRRLAAKSRLHEGRRPRARQPRRSTRPRSRPAAMFARSGDY